MPCIRGSSTNKAIWSLTLRLGFKENTKVSSAVHTLRNSVFGVVFAMLGSVFYIPEAEAKRLGGGGSLGRTSSSLFKSYSTPKKPAQTDSATQSSRQAAAPTQSTTAAGAAAQPRKSMMGPLGGLAAGLGLAALFGFLGFGEGMASFLGTVLMLGVGFLLIRALFRMLASTASARRLAHQAQGGQNVQRQQLDFPQTPVNNMPKAMSHSGHQSVSSTRDDIDKSLPAGFDEAAFVESAKRFFTMIQAKFDEGDLNALREYCTDDVFDFARQEIQARNGQSNHTSVVTLTAELVGFEVDVDEELATVAFSALIREHEEAAAHEINEMWIMTRPLNGSGWLLAGIHNL